MSAVQTRPLGALGRIGVVAAGHAAIILVVANGFGLIPEKAATPPRVVTEFFPDEPVRHEDPGPIRHDLERLTVRLPEPERVPMDDTQAEGEITAELVPHEEIPVGSGSAAVLPELVGPRTDPRFPLTRPRYPAEAIRDQIEGAVVVEVFVQPDGRVGDARIVTSSGYDFFDRATLEEARRKWRMLPATRDGEPYAQWYRTRVVFKLANR
jgi:protein TonB